MTEENKGAAVALPEPKNLGFNSDDCVWGYTAEMMLAFRAEGEADLRARLAAAEAEVARFQRAAKIAELKASGTLANNLCPDHRDKQVGQPCLACSIERLRAQRDEAVALLDEVRCNFTRDDDLPNGLLLRIDEAVQPTPSPADDRAECSGDPASCPENEGYGCCKPNPLASLKEQAA